MTDQLKYITVIEELDTLWARIEKDTEERMELLKRIETLEQK